MPRGCASQSRAATLRSWQQEKRGELRYAVVRHAERADAAWDDDWACSADAKAYPFDAPLTPAGVQQAQASGARLRQLEPPQEGWGVVICSPFFRCVQTSIEVCKATGASLIIDHDWSEVCFPEMLEAREKQQGLTRPHEFLAEFVAQAGVNLRNPDAPRGLVWDRKRSECLQDARVRYARKFVVCLDRAMLSHTSFIVVSHGECVPGCLQLLPEFRGAEVVSTPFCGMVVGRLEQSSARRKRSPLHVEITGTPSASDAHALATLLDGLSVIETNCEIRRLTEALAKPGWGSLPAWMRSRQAKLRASFEDDSPRPGAGELGEN